MTGDKKGKKYSDLELELLCQAGLRVCEDNINGVQNKQRDCEDKIFTVFQELVAKRPGLVLPYRSRENLWRKFKSVGAEVTKFQSAYTQAENSLPSGHTDVMGRAKEIFKMQNKDRPFKLLTCYYVLRSRTKWAELIKTGASSAQLDNKDGTDEVREKPFGRDKAKAARASGQKTEQGELQKLLANNTRLSTLSNTVASLAPLVNIYPDLEAKHRSYISTLLELQDNDLAGYSGSAAGSAASETFRSQKTAPTQLMMSSLTRSALS